jgi:hypothetical protein
MPLAESHDSPFILTSQLLAELWIVALTSRNYQRSGCICLVDVPKTDEPLVTTRRPGESKEMMSWLEVPSLKQGPSGDFVGESVGVNSFAHRGGFAPATR